MVRKLRVEYPGAIYHVMNRGDRREPIFRDDPDRQRFMATLGEACAKTGWQVQADGPVPDHFHRVVETPQPNWVAGMKSFLGTDTSRCNRRRQLFGHRFSGRYPALVVDSTTPGYRPASARNIWSIWSSAGRSTALDWSGRTAGALQHPCADRRHCPSDPKRRCTDALHQLCAFLPASWSSTSDSGGLPGAKMGASYPHSKCFATWQSVLALAALQVI